VEGFAQIIPEVQLLALDRNLGLVALECGVSRAKNDVVVLLTRHARAAGIPRPILDGFTDETVFQCLVRYFLATDETARRDRSHAGMVEDGGLRVTHRETRQSGTVPVFLRRWRVLCVRPGKVSVTGRIFDELLAPFYLEDTDLGYLGGARGGRVLYHPRALFIMNIAAPSGSFSANISRVCCRTSFCLAWKNIHNWAY